MWDYHQNDNRDSFSGSHVRQKKIVNIINKNKIDRNSSVLDIGFGDGKLLELIYKSGYQCYGIDFSKENIDLTKKIFYKHDQKIILKEGDISKIPFDDGYFQVVVASEVLEHLDNGVLERGLKEVNRVLSNRGVFIGTVPYQENLQEDLTICPHCKTVYHRWGHQQSYDQSKIYNLLKQAGFKTIKIHAKNFMNPNLNMVGRAESVLKSIMKKYKNYLFIAYK